MTALAPTMQVFFTERLTRQRLASPHTVAAYRDALKLLLTFAAGHTGAQPSQLDIAELDAPLIGVFLEHLERDRGNNVVRWGRDVTLAEDLLQVRTGSASQIMVSLRNLAISLHRLACASNIAATLRHHARDPARPLRLLKLI